MAEGAGFCGTYHREAGRACALLEAQRDRHRTPADDGGAPLLPPTPLTASTLLPGLAFAGSPLKLKDAGWQKPPQRA